MVDNSGGRTTGHGHPISSPCEPYGSGELKKEDFDSSYGSLGLQHIFQASLEQF